MSVLLAVLTPILAMAADASSPEEDTGGLGRALGLIGLMIHERDIDGVSEFILDKIKEQGLRDDFDSVQTEPIIIWIEEIDIQHKNGYIENLELGVVVFYITGNIAIKIPRDMEHRKLLKNVFTRKFKENSNQRNPKYKRFIFNDLPEKQMNRIRAAIKSLIVQLYDEGYFNCYLN